MIDLKGGFQTTDRRLDRLPEHDPENFRYLAIRTLTTRTPRSYTWSCDKWLDQGQEGACVGFSFAHDGIARPARLLDIDARYAREKIYFEAQKIDPWEGGAYPGASPFYEGTSVLSGAKAAQALGHFGGYEWAYNVNDLILAVGYKGPAILGLDWQEGMWDTDADGYIHATGQVEGGHAILIRAVSLKGKYFLLRNSWGRGWGEDGDCKVSFDDMALILNQGGEACIPVKRYVRPSRGAGRGFRIPF